jgi:hypothetical protein
MARNDALFWGGHLRDYLEGRLGDMIEEIEATPEEHVLQTGIDTWADALAESYTLAVPTLRRDAWYMDEPGAIRVDVSWDHFRRAITDPSRPTYVPGYRAVVHVPFDGDANVFSLRPNTFTTVLPHALIRSGEVIIDIEYPQDTPVDIEAHATEELDRIDRWLGFARQDAEVFHSRLAQEARSRIADRRQRIERQRAQLAQTRIPIRRQGETGKTRIVDAVVRRPSPARALKASQRVALDPTLAADVYEHILVIMRDTARSMEQSPQTYTQMGEEDRRQLFINALNSHYSGQVTAEAFNASGKTDILVKYEDRNLFLGECKFWSGKQGFQAAVDQLFSYATWRDSKLAAIMFVRQRGLTEVIARGREALEARPDFVRWSDSDEETELRVVMRWPGDEEKEAELAVLFVHTPERTR